MDDFISGATLANRADSVFSRTISQYEMPVYHNIDIKSGYSIFCKTDNIYQLFNLLNIRSDLSDLKIITHESDYAITKDIFDLKPANVEKGYAINVNYDHKNLIPIPLGIANSYCGITLKVNNLNSLKYSPTKLLYINHRVNTNPEERQWIYDYFSDKEWCTIKTPNLSLEEYKIDLDDHKFMLCPNGNGIDTHRLWECLYHKGIIPVIESHVNYKMCELYPVLIVHSFKDLTEEFLKQKYHEIKSKDFDSEILSVDYIINKIKNKEGWL